MRGLAGVIGGRKYGWICFFLLFLLSCTYAWSGFLPWDLSYFHSSVPSIGNLLIVDILENHLLAFGFALGLD